jgi:hypothetical protein
MTQCPIYFCCCTPLRQLLAYLNQPKMIVATEDHRVVISTNSHGCRMSKLLAVWGGNAQVGVAVMFWNLYPARVSFESRPRHNPGISTVFFSPPIQIPEQYLDETNIASFQILSNSPFINEPLIRRYTVSPRCCVQVGNQSFSLRGRGLTLRLYIIYV